MRILLVQPPVGHQLGYDRMARVEPLGLESLAGALPNHEVKVADLRLRDNLDKLLRTFSPDLCGLSCSFTMGVGKTIECARRVKAVKPDTVVVVGGVHASIAPKDLRDPAIDALAKGEGESLLAEVVAALERGAGLETVAGLHLNTEDGQVFTGRRSLLEDLDSLPFPRRDLGGVSPKSYYFNFWRPLSLVETSRGCPYRCSFCSVWRFYRGTNRHKSAERVVEEVLQVPGRYILFTDDNFFDDVPRAKSIAEMLSAQGVEKRYSAQVRADVIAANPELVDMWYEAGLRHVLVGFEAVSDERLTELRKDTDLDTADAAMSVLLRYPDLSVTGSFIVDPAFTAEEFERLKRYVLEKRISAPQFSILTPLPGTALFSKFRDQLITKNYEMFDFMHSVLPTRLDLEDFYSEFSSLYRTAYQPGKLPFGQVGTLVKGLAKRQFTLRHILGVLRVVRDLGCPAKYLREHEQLLAEGRQVG